MIIVLASCRYFQQGFSVLVENVLNDAPSFKKVRYIDDITQASKADLAQAQAIVVDYGASDTAQLSALLDVKNHYPHSYFIFITRAACYESTIENILINTLADFTIDCKNAVRKLSACLAHFSRQDQRVTIFKNIRLYHLEKEKPLTRMEKMLLPYIVMGKKNKEITRYLDLTGKTVSHHRRNIYRKFAVTNLTGLYKKIDHNV